MPLSPLLQARLVRYDELKPCTNAFIDARSPGSDQKENFTIIGPGVAENPHQHVHIREPHGFNIGGARQPPRCTNSLHSHLSEEVFIIHTGEWRFFWGEHGTAGQVRVGPGDVISLPINIFRGFENVGSAAGFMFAVLGGDDPGRVHWAPHVIEKARSYGLVLLDDGSLVDTTEGEKIPAGRSAVLPSTRAEIAYIREPAEAEIAARVVRSATLQAVAASPLTATGVREAAIIGTPGSTDGFATSPIGDAHNFTLRHLALDAGARTSLHTRECVEVLMVQSGRAVWRNDAGDSTLLCTGDTFTVPRGMARQIEALEETNIFVVRGGNDPGAVTPAPSRAR